MDTETFDINNCYVSPATTTTVGATTNCINWNYPYVYASPDRGTQAYNVIKALVNKKLVECKSASQFMALMDEVMKAL